MYAQHERTSFFLNIHTKTQFSMTSFSIETNTFLWFISFTTDRDNGSEITFRKSKSIKLIWKQKLRCVDHYIIRILLGGVDRSLEGWRKIITFQIKTYKHNRREIVRTETWEWFTHSMGLHGLNVLEVECEFRDQGSIPNKNQSLWCLF